MPYGTGRTNTSRRLLDGRQSKIDRSEGNAGAMTLIEPGALTPPEKRPNTVVTYRRKEWQEEARNWRIAVL